MDVKTILYWHRLEHFYPYILKEQHSQYIKSYYISSGSNFPDFSNPGIPKEKEIRRYEVYLGIFKVDSALDVLMQKLGAQEEFRDEGDEESCFCKFSLSAYGIFNVDSFRISSFPWAVQRVKYDDIDMNNWDEGFHEYEKRLFLELFQLKEPYSFTLCYDVLNKIREDIGWEIKFSDCWMRIDQVTGKKKLVKEQKEEENKQEFQEEIKEENKQVDDFVRVNDLLNSFFIRDLEKVIANVELNDYGQALDSYVLHDVKERIDIEKDKNRLFEIFNPNKIPYGKWPSGYPLRSMQQAAVNISIDQKESSEKIFSVNGPPGTGKTTLLKDIIAANIVERALLLSNYKNPNDVFTKEIGKYIYKNYASHIKDIDVSLKKYGILVASNNNTAVKNITVELPLMSSLKQDYQGDYTYFNEISDALLEKRTWGICAAELGKKKNCGKFIDNFWPINREDDQGKTVSFDFNVYLRNLHAGSNKRTDTECQKYWKEAKDKFLEAYQSVHQEYEKLSGSYQILIQVRSLQREKFERERIYQQKAEHLVSLTVQKEQKEKSLIELEIGMEKCMEQQREIQNHVIFFKLKYLLHSKNKLMEQYRLIEERIQNILSQKFMTEDEIADFDKSINLTEMESTQEQHRITIFEQKISECEKSLELVRAQPGEILPDEEFLSDLIGDNTEEKHKKAQDRAPWNSDRLNELRERLFLEAMNLHKAFVENSSQMRVQLDTFNKMIRQNMLSSEEKKKFSGILFQSFMLVVPVISTTFASVGSFLANVAKEEFGILLIDEAGQALPQSAVGAIWRAKRVVMVGDPLQIDPVVTLHDKTIKYLKQYFKQSDFIASKETSVQSLADHANKYVGIRSVEGNEFYIGSPLLVHGRCQRKIFDIANLIAYNNKMIYGTKDVERTNCKWIDVKGVAEDKHFVRHQAEVILPIIKEEFRKVWKEEGFHRSPSLYIITPFRSVKSGMESYLKNKNFLYNELQEEEEPECKAVIDKWIDSNVGTVHTFQGKEADTVIFCLGVDSGNKGYGAVQWASNKPNILNVAVTRAKKNLYIVGDAEKWATANYFADAYRICSII